MKKLVIDTAISSAISCVLAALLSILAPILGSIIPIEITSAVITVITFVFVFVWYRYVRNSDGAKIVHRDYPEKTGVYSFKSDLKIMLKGERNVFVIFLALAVIAHALQIGSYAVTSSALQPNDLKIGFYNVSLPFVVQIILIFMYPFGVMNNILNYFKVSGSMLPVTAILLFVANIVLICLLYVIVLSVRRRKWIKEWLSM